MIRITEPSMLRQNGLMQYYDALCSEQYIPLLYVHKIHWSDNRLDLNVEWLKELQESMDKGTGCRDIIINTVENAVNHHTINKSNNQSLTCRKFTYSERF